MRARVVAQLFYNHYCILFAHVTATTRIPHAFFFFLPLLNSVSHPQLTIEDVLSHVSLKVLGLQADIATLMC